METMILPALIALAGLAWGSFLNVVIYRVPRDMSLVRPPSTCPNCRTRIKFYDNIPVVSYLVLRGKCRRCGGKISIAYPLVELSTALAFLLLFHYYSWTLHFLASCLFASALIAVCVIDLYHQIIPDAITLPGLVLALIYSNFRTDLGFRQSLIGAAVGAGFLLFVYAAYFLVRRKEGLGMGDVTLMLLIGAYLGWLPTLLTLILASLCGAVIGILIISVGKKDMQYALPFGTFLAPAAFVALLWGEKIIAAYLALFRR
ncbi:MAG: prepilin peptidase [Acidobacteriota bacterium]|nr:prepilin peptidase [Acidobacteriota bacterium]